MSINSFTSSFFALHISDPINYLLSHASLWAVCDEETVNETVKSIVRFKKKKQKRLLKTSVIRPPAETLHFIFS